MEKIVKDLKKVIHFKDTTDVGDVVLIVTRDPQLIIYGLVSAIKKDMTKKQEWYHVSMDILSVPPQKVIWTLRPKQMTGQEIFSMAGDPRFMQAVDFSVAHADGNESSIQEPKSHLRRVK